MNFILTADRQFYRRWINILPTLIIPGYGHFLSRRKKAALGWFLGYLLLAVFQLISFFTPSSSYSFGSPGWFAAVEIVFRIMMTAVPVFPVWFAAVNIAFLILMTADTCRRPIPRIGIKGWIVLFCIYLAIFVAPMYFCKEVIMHPYKIPTGSMQPTLMGKTSIMLNNEQKEERPADHIFFNKLAYLIIQPQRGDVVIFKPAEVNHPMIPAWRRGQTELKRIVGIPGDTVSIQPPHVLIDGKKLLEPSIFTTISSPNTGYHGYTLLRMPSKRIYMSSPEDVIKLAENEFFVLGDNSRNSFDSRIFGPIPRKSIVGKAYYISAPPERREWIR